jgi:predicted nucleic acid-binding protein
MGVSRVFWDTNLFIYLFEDAGEHADRVQAVRSRMVARGDVLLTSALTIGEILVQPTRLGRTDLGRQYEQRIAQAAEIVPFDLEAARAYATVRADAGVKGPDAVQLACAVAARTNLFITNDERLSGRVVPGIDFIVSLARVPL